MQLIDFTNCKKNPYRAYGGANGSKLGIVYNGDSYMLKFPPKPHRNRELSYTNGCISEYLGCHIFESMGFKTQETLLGTYTDGQGKEKVVTACRDFTDSGKRLLEFAQLKNACIDSEQNGYGTELSSILEAIEEQELVSPVKLKEFFWEMFIADALLGNFDRHNGNWGLLVDEEKQTAEIAPIYDCGSCLYPQLSVAGMEEVLSDPKKMDERVYDFPSSMIKQEGAKLSYFGFISSLENADCTAALLRVLPRINMEKINQIIDEAPGLETVQRDFYKIMLARRKALILDYSMRLLQRQKAVLGHFEDTEQEVALEDFEIASDRGSQEEPQEGPDLTM